LDEKDEEEEEEEERAFSLSSEERVERESEHLSPRTRGERTRALSHA